jgi:uncharacterized protein YjbI with pentapeptide repeats
MKVLFVFLFLQWTHAADKTSFLCEGQSNKGGCYNFEKETPLRSELPKDSSYSNFYKVIIRTNMEDRDFRGSEFQEAEFQNNQGGRSDYSKSDFKAFRAHGANFNKSIFQNTDFRAAKIFFAEFKNCDFLNADFSGADISFSDFSDANLKGANLTDTWYVGSIFKGARIDSRTKLPFSLDKARQLGMIIDEAVLEKDHR